MLCTVFRSDCTNCVVAKRMAKHKYKKTNITSKTRLSDLVEKKYHPQLQQMMEELRKLADFNGESEWWRVRYLIFVNPRTQLNYVPLANFISKLAYNNQEGLKCSIDTFFRYIASSEHSNLNAKWKSVKTMVYSYIRYENQKEKQ